MSVKVVVSVPCCCHIPLVVSCRLQAIRKPKLIEWKEDSLFYLFVHFFQYDCSQNKSISSILSTVCILYRFYPLDKDPLDSAIHPSYNRPLFYFWY